MFDVVQNKRGPRVQIALTEQEREESRDSGLLWQEPASAPEAGPDKCARLATYFADDSAHAQRLYEYISRRWFMPSPVLFRSLGGSLGGPLPMAEILVEAGASPAELPRLWQDVVRLGGEGQCGLSSYWGDFQPASSESAQSGALLPWLNVLIAMAEAVRLPAPGLTVALPVSHPDIMDFLNFQASLPPGSLLQTTLLLPDAFMRAVEADGEWVLTAPGGYARRRRLKARVIWGQLLACRLKTGAPSLLFVDRANRSLPEQHRLAGLSVKMAGGTGEVNLPTGCDHLGRNRAAYSCPAALNLTHFLSWHTEPRFIEDVLRFLDNVLEDFIASAPAALEEVRYGAERARSLSLGVVGFASFLQSQRVAWEGEMASTWNGRIFTHIRAAADAASRALALEHGPCPDAADYGLMERFSHKLALGEAPDLAALCGVSPGILPPASFALEVGEANPWLQEELTARRCDTPASWESVAEHQGSVQHLACLDEAQRQVFRTAYEIDPRRQVDLAAQRAPSLCQSQALPLFLPQNFPPSALSSLHLLAWHSGLKTLSLLTSYPAPE